MENCFVQIIPFAGLIQFGEIHVVKPIIRRPWIYLFAFIICACTRFACLIRCIHTRRLKLLFWSRWFIYPCRRFHCLINSLSFESMNFPVMILHWLQNGTFIRYTVIYDPTRCFPYGHTHTFTGVKEQTVYMNGHVCWVVATRWSLVTTDRLY